MALVLLDRITSLIESFGKRDSVSHFSPGTLISLIGSRISELEEIDKSECYYLVKSRKREIKSLIRLDLRALRSKDDELYEEGRNKYYDYLRNS